MIGASPALPACGTTGKSGSCRVIAVLPLEVRHLLRQHSHLFSARAARRRVQRVAGRAQLRAANVRRLLRLEPAGRSLHDVLVPCSIANGPYSGMLALRLRGIDHKVPAEALLGAELLFADLVTHGAGHAILRFLCILSCSSGRRRRSRPSCPSAWPRSAESACGRSSIRPRPRPSIPDGRSPRAANWPASTDRATSWP